MDFVVAGIPRSGTTIFAKALNASDSVYSYSSETALFQYLVGFGWRTPFPKVNIRHLREFLLSEYTKAFVRRNDFYKKNLDAFNNILNLRRNPGDYKRFFPLFRPEDVEPFADQIVGLFADGLYGERLLESGATVLSEWFRAGTARPIVGEKTPDNILVSRQICASLPDATLFATVRNPVEVIKSMQKRGEGDATPDKGFDARFMPSLGQMYMYAKCVLKTLKEAPAGKLVLIPYERLLAEPEKLLDEALSRLGVTLDPDGRTICRRLVKQTDSGGDNGRDLTEAERRAMALVFGPLSRLLGSPGLLVQADAHPLGSGSGRAVDTATVAPVYGFYGDNQTAENRLFGKEAYLWVTVPNGKSRLRIRFYSDFPVLGDGAEASLEIWVNHSLVAKLVAENGPWEGEAIVDIDSHNPVQWDGSSRVLFVELESSLTYRPITVEGRGLDVRETSFLLRSVEAL